MWRLLNGLLPYDDVLARMGFSGASKCPFCLNLDCIRHCFVDCLLARLLWNYFTVAIGIYFSYISLSDLLNTCWDSRHLFASILGLLPTLQQFTMVSPSVVTAAAVVRLLGIFPSLRLQHRVPAPVSVSWLRPRTWKLNVDGSSRGKSGLAGGGVVVRDATGFAHLTLSIFLGFGSSLFAETMALLRGL